MPFVSAACAGAALSPGKALADKGCWDRLQVTHSSAAGLAPASVVLQIHWSVQFIDAQLSRLAQPSAEVLSDPHQYCRSRPSLSAWNVCAVLGAVLSRGSIRLCAQFETACT
jgi:hypothetical protein